MSPAPARSDSHVRATVIGAGPYGLSIAAHLAHAGVSHRVFGVPMDAWASHMPAGMHLKSTPEASNLSSPPPGAGLADYCRCVGDPAPVEEHPIPVEQFVAYGRWFQERHVPQLQQAFVANVRSAPEGFDVKLDSGEAFHSDKVIVAAGFIPFASTPAALDPLRLRAPQLVSHAADHGRLDGFAGKDVALVGAGQSALEAAVLLHEQGARVHVIARCEELLWGGPPVKNAGPLYRVLKPEAGLGPGWSHFTVGRWPGLVRHLPAAARLRLVSAILGPSGAWWLRPRFTADIAVHTATVIRSAEVAGDRARLRLGSTSAATQPTGTPQQIDVDHVIACTGYRPSMASLGFLADDLAEQVRTFRGWPVLDAGFGSSVPGMHFAGLAAAGTFGPVMRFVYGSDFAARRVAAAVTTGR